MAVKAKAPVLTLAQQTAIEAINADINRLKNKLRAVMVESGLNPDKAYRIQPDGTVEEAADAVAPV